MLERHDTDILILGTGGAGLFAALHASKAAPELRVTLAVKGLTGKCGCTRMVQGGYNVAIAPGDSVERHFMDTIIGGKWLPHQDMAWKLCETAVERIRELENEIGCFFDRNPDGSVHQKAFAGQTFDRTVHKGDLTGIEIISRLMEQVLATGVERLEEHRAIALVPTPDGAELSGVLFIDMRSGGFHFVRADDVPLPHTIRRQEHGWPFNGHAARLADARYGDGAVSSHRSARWRRNPHDRHGAGRRPARCRRASAGR